jgi:hypothetical protein
MALDHFLGSGVKRPVPGFTFGRTEQGWAVVHLHYTADPRRNAEWVAKERNRYTSQSKWDMDQEINPWAEDGSLVYPEFNPSIHVISHHEIPLRGCIYMGIDPHPRTPHAFLWILVDRWGDMYVYRELWPSKAYAKPKNLKNTEEDNRFTIREYAEMVAKLEGNSLSWKNPETPNEYATYHENPNSERVIARYMDQAGKGFMANTDTRLEESYWDRYQNFGIPCEAPKKAHQAGEDAIRDALRPRIHDLKGTWPRLHISDRCPELQLEIRRHRYPMLRRNDPGKELPQAGAEVRKHLLDILRYLLTADLGYYPRMESTRCRMYQ